ncbi:radical SAM protein [Burkholderia cenocepacia]|uniref:B12-binding domain-containing radical SAM protein n=1 Tax=Burkholderia cenocepacia TaxID=95486 RepID=UPI001B929682|nr:radical SAM protein [Burkholderia cenocepacia]MBR8278382.1 radical SAM protein [Burkholderia cenocepacia]
MNVQLVTSPYVDYGSWLTEGVTPRMTPYVSVGLLSLAAVIRREHHVSIFDVNEYWNIYLEIYNNREQLYRSTADAILNKKPDLIGFMTEYYTYHHVLAIAHAVKQRAPETIIIFGGPQATATDIATLSKYPAVDIIVRGEGEITFPEILKHIAQGLPIDNVNGITRRLDGLPIRTTKRDLLMDLDQLPIPAFDLCEIHPEDLLMVEAGRGCPFSCTFCSTNDFWSRRYRVKSPGRLVAELRELSSQFGVKNFSLVHDCLTASRVEVIAICEALESANLGIKWGCSSRTDTIDTELIGKMASAGCAHLYFGIESGDEQTQKDINKRLDLEHAYAMIESARANRIEVTTPFMLGFPGETAERIQKTFEAIYRALAADVYLVQIFATAPYGDTPLLDNHGKSIKYTGHFLDISLSEDDKRRRDNEIMAAPEIFSGHFRYRTEENAFDLSGADQFFPLLNEMRFTALAIWRITGDAAYLYVEWTRYLAQPIPRRNQRLKGTPAYGTFQQFSLFLDSVIRKFHSAAPYLPELLDYERTRMELVEQAMKSGRDYYNPHLSRAFPHEETRLQLGSNVALRRYQYDIPALISSMLRGVAMDISKTSNPIAMVGVNERKLDVFTLTSFTADVLEFSSQKMTVEDIAYRITRQLKDEDQLGAFDEIREKCLEAAIALEKGHLISWVST